MLSIFIWLYFNDWQVSCGCHHSALLTREGVLYVWGRNLDGQLGSGTRKEIPIPTPLTSPATSATSSTRVNLNMTFIT